MTRTCHVPEQLFSIDSSVSYSGTFFSAGAIALFFAAGAVTLFTVGGFGLAFAGLATGFSSLAPKLNSDDSGALWLTPPV